MKKYIIIFFFSFITITNASQLIKKKIILNLNSIDNITFNFEQNINGKIESGNCTIQYPKKIFCKYDTSNKKILVSNGKSLVIKTSTSYYLYPLDKTPLNYILSKKYLLDKIHDIDERIIDNKFVNYSFSENNNEINIFFNKNNFDLIGWQTIDIYQNLNILYLNSVSKNQKLNEKLFKLPTQD